MRLTWKWKATRGLRTAADYSFDDYSQAGIVWNFDGIYNQGVGVERSTTATTWKNLAPNPVTSVLFVQRINSARNNYDNSSALSSLEPVGDRDPGEWTEDGFRLKGDSRWRGLGQVGPVANWTLQTLVDADVADVVNDIMYVISVSWSNFAVVLRKNNSVANSFHFNVQDTSSSIDRPYIQNESGKYDFATAILDSSDRTAKMFSGVTPPSGGTIADGYYQFPSITPFKDTNFGLGASVSYTEFFIGTLKSVRYYDRVLTEEEIVRNRNVDAVRYFGALGVTNVVVATKYGDVAGEEEVLAEARARKDSFWRRTPDFAAIKAMLTEVTESKWSARRMSTLWPDGKLPANADEQHAALFPSVRRKIELLAKVIVEEMKTPEPKPEEEQPQEEEDLAFTISVTKTGGRVEAKLLKGGTPVVERSVDAKLQPFDEAMKDISSTLGRECLQLR